MQEVVTTVLDVLALVLIAAGIVVGLWPWADGFAIAAGGVVVGAGSFVAARR